MSKADLVLFKCSIVEGPDLRFCAVRAIDQQLALLSTANDGQAPSPTSTLFRRVRLWSPILGAEPTTVECLRGCAAWVSTCTNRERTFKYIGRRAAMTNLSNSGLSLQQVSKFFGLHVNTVSKYYKATKSEHLQAARVFGGLVPKVDGNEAGGSWVSPKTEEAAAHGSRPATSPLCRSKKMYIRFSLKLFYIRYRFQGLPSTINN